MKSDEMWSDLQPQSQCRDKNVQVDRNVETKTHGLILLCFGMGCG